LRDNPDLSDELEKRIKEKLGIGPRVDAPSEAEAVAVVEAPVEF
jgi:recombination protein RecA